MGTKRVLRFSAIVDFFKDEEKLISRGENAVESNHIKDMIFDGELLIIRGNVHASMRDKLYKVELTLDSNKDIDKATCSCPRGQLMCHHMSALPIYAYHNISTTDVACSWNTRKASTKEVKSISELFSCKKHTSTCGTVNDQAFEQFKTDLGMFRNAVGFTWLLRNEPTITQELPDIETVMFSKEYLEAEDKMEYFKNVVKVTDQQILRISQKTIGQSSNELWLVARKNRLTSSNFGIVLSAIKNGKYPPSLFKRLTESYTLSGVKAIQWGKLHEADGIFVLEKCRNINIQSTGLWLDPCGFIGGSPDGIIEDDQIVEVKCPYKLRESKSLTNDLNDKMYILFLNDTNEVELNQTHPYYHQIQGNLFLTKKRSCCLVIWTPSESIIYDVVIDEEWKKNLNFLKKFYLNNYLPFLCGK